MQKFEIPWAAWRGRKKQQLTFPNNWKVTMASMAGRKNVGEDEIKQAFANPIGHETVRKLAEGKKTAAIAVDDLTRPTQAFRFMPFIVEELRKGGIGEDGIKIIMAIGCHRPLMKADQEKKLGKKMANRFPVFNNHPYEYFVDLGKTSRGTPVQINRHFVEADLKIGVGFITPHPTAGFGGGGKIVIPVADQFYGYRSGRIQDPAGHLWIVSKLIEEVSPQEMQKRMDMMAAAEDSLGGGA